MAHLLNIEVAVEPVARIEDPDWRWFVGLDAEATRIGNALWTGEEIEADAQSRMLALFRLTFPNARAVEQRMAGFPVYLLLAMSDGQACAHEAAEPDRRLAAGGRRAGGLRAG